MLTADQINFFKLHGYLVVPGLIEPVILDEWRRQVWAYLGEDERDAATWKKRSYTFPEFTLKPPAVTLDEHPRFRAIIHQLGGGKFVGGGANAPLAHWPSENTNWSPTEWGHLDGYYPGRWDPFMMAATVYAYDCQPMGGGFTYWPDSHLTTHRYFRENPDQVDGRFRDEPGFGWGGPNEFTRHAPQPPQTFDANAGDVLLWHAYMVHSGSMNCRRVPRFAFIARYNHRDQESFRHELPENLWKYWAI